MKKIVKLTESDLLRIVQRVVQEGKTDKGVKEKDSDVKIERFQDTIKNFIKSHDCKVKQVGDDFEIHSDGEHVGQVMFRKDGITVKKQGSKFGKEFDFNELGKVKSEIKKLTESNLTRIVKRVVKENEEIKEDVDPMVGIDNFLNNPVMITLATAWLLSGKYKMSNLKSNLEDMKTSFLDYCNSMGYVIDKEVLDFKFKQLLKKITSILGL